MAIKTDYTDIAFKDNGKLKLLIIVGTRPEIIRLSAVIQKCRQYFDCILAHTGQNYDYNLNGVFFKDLQQIIGIGLQLGMWATPILWDMNMLNPTMQKIMGLNPLVYVVEGYRNAVYGRQWFFEDFFSTMYFWIITVVLFGIGALVFKRLKVHFADVL